MDKSLRHPLDRSTHTQRDPLHAPHAYVKPGDPYRTHCVRCGRPRENPVHTDADK